MNTSRSQSRGFALRGHACTSVTRGRPELQHDSDSCDKQRENAPDPPEEKTADVSPKCFTDFDFLNSPYKRRSRSWWRCVLFRSSGASPMRTRVGTEKKKKKKNSPSWHQACLQGATMTPRWQESQLRSRVFKNESDDRRFQWKLVWRRWLDSRWTRDPPPLPPPPPTGNLITFMWAPVLDYTEGMIRLASFVSVKKNRLYIFFF